jgi:antitoxin (DNA-binding transcriptional repressor) of toxin-antitoxin stability system
MHQVNVEQAKKSLPELIDAAIKGEEVVITKDDQQVVKLVPIPGTKAHPQFGSARGLITISDDFDEPLPDFEEYSK